MWGEKSPARPEGLLAQPGRYSVRLNAGGKSLSQPLVLKMDPRISVSAEAIRRQFEIESQAAESMDKSFERLNQVREFRRNLASAQPAPDGETLRTAAAFEEARLGFGQINAWLTAIFKAVEGSDSAPTAQAVAELADANQKLEALTARWDTFRAARK